jgi:hypothetical protein
MFHRFPEDFGRRKRWDRSAGQKSDLVGYAGDGSIRTRGLGRGKRRAAPMNANSDGTPKDVPYGTGKTVPILRRFI